MKQRILKLTENQKIRYIVVGGSSFAVEFSLFAVLEKAGTNLFVANSLSFLAGLLMSFWLHKQWSFAGDHKMQTGKQFVSYVILAGTNLVLTNIIIGLLVNAVGLPGLGAKVLTMFAIVIWNFFFMSRLIFKQAEVN